MAYKPVQEFLGPLPDMSGEVVEHSMPVSIPKTAEEILVYAWVTTRGDEAFHRYYYQIETVDKSLRAYPQYMNVAATEDIVLNSSNLWMPVSDPSMLRVTLIDAEPNPKAKKKSIGHKRPTVRLGTKESVDAHSEIFIIGYR